MTIGEVLAPVRERYAAWLGLPESQVRRDEDHVPRAIQLVLRLERDGTPSRADALALAASGSALLCLHPDSAPGGVWHEALDAYCRGRIRKVTRRARGAHWRATEGLPGLNLSAGPGDATQIRVLVPGPVDDLDKRVARLQVGGTDLPVDEQPPLVTDAPVLTCTVPADLDITAGKLMAQTGHAGMIAAALAADDAAPTLSRWHEAGCPVRIETTDATTWTELLETVDDPERAWQHERRLAVRDAGYTEIDPGTVTVVARLSDGG